MTSHVSHRVNVRLSCHVSAAPPAQVTWYRGHDMVSHDLRHVATSEDVGGHVTRHLLTISGVGDTDYGNYSCLASNNVGSDRYQYGILVNTNTNIRLFPRAYIELHGRPSIPVFSETPDGNYLAWSLQSSDPVDLYRVLIRQVNEVTH